MEGERKWVEEEESLNSDQLLGDCLLPFSSASKQQVSFPFQSAVADVRAIVAQTASIFVLSRRHFSGDWKYFRAFFAFYAWALLEDESALLFMKQSKARTDDEKGLGRKGMQTEEPGFYGTSNHGNDEQIS